MSWKIRTNALVTPFSSFHNLGKLDRTLASPASVHPWANSK